MTTPEHLPLTSLDITEDRKALLHKSFPEVFREDKIDFEALQRALGDWVDPGKERFGLNWPGKAACSKLIQQASVGTLLPMREQSVDFDSTENLIIEGDNLEVLKLLQKSYYGKVKMIYIDPPYNTGNEFIYPDNFHEGLQDYLKYSGQVDEEGRKQSSNAETGGRYHSNWLSMMYPRLFLARNLLREDGVIFVSIDDHEVHNLRMIMDEIFGAENFVSENVIVANKRGQTYKEISKTHEYLLIYSINSDVSLYELEKNSDALPYSDSIGPFDLWELRNRNPKFGKFNRPNLFFPIYASPSILDEKGYAKVSLYQTDLYNVEVFPLNSVGAEGCWRWGKDKVNTQDLIGISPSLVARQRRDGGWNVYEKSRKSTTKAKSLWDESDVISEQGTVQLGTYELGGLFDHPKPVGLIAKAGKIATKADDIILDFFAGSGTTGEAIFQLNKEDKGNRKFILVQLPEPTDNPTYPTIADITRERVRRVSTKLKAAQAAPDLLSDASTAPDLGFKAMRLSSSNFKVWDGRADRMTDVGTTLKLFAEHVLPGRTSEDILYELLLKTGFPLTTPLSSLTLAGKQVFRAAEGALLICLEHALSLEVIEAMVALDPWLILCLDAGFSGQDQLKANAMQTVRAHNRNRQSSMSLKVV